MVASAAVHAPERGFVAIHYVEASDHVSAQARDCDALKAYNRPSTSLTRASLTH